MNEKALQVLHNSDEFVRKWNEFLAAPAGNISLEYYDQNGNLQTATFSNRNKLVQDFIANVNSAMSKTFYVDAVNGSDLNDGSSTTPFKTLKKAVDSVPVGGFGRIILMSDIQLNDFLVIENKAVEFTSINTSSPVTISNKEIISTESTTNYRNTTGIIVVNSYVLFNTLNLNHINMVGTDTTLSYGAFLIRGESSFIHFRNCGVSIGSDPIQSLVLTDTWDGGFTSVSIRNCNITTNGGVVFRCINNSGGALFSANTTINNDTKWAAGIIKDTNGTPRNIVSNIVL